MSNVNDINTTNINVEIEATKARLASLERRKLIESLPTGEKIAFAAGRALTVAEETGKALLINTCVALDRCDGTTAVKVIDTGFKAGQVAGRKICTWLDEMSGWCDAKLDGTKLPKKEGTVSGWDLARKG